MSNQNVENTENQTNKTLSEAQLLANLRNAQKSTGPRTEPGKAHSSMNARRHGLTGQFFVMNEADRLAYETFEKGLIASLKPVGAYEHQLAVSISQDQWRINRSRAIEFNTLGLGHEERKAAALANTPGSRSRYNSGPHLASRTPRPHQHLPLRNPRQSYDLQKREAPHRTPAVP